MLAAPVMFPPAEESFAGDRVRLWRKPLDWEEGFALYQRGRNLSERTITTYLWGLKVLAKWTGKAPSELTTRDLMSFMQRSTYPATTTAQIITAGKQGHKWAAVMGLCELNGVMALSPPKTPKPKKAPPVSLETARRMLAAARTPTEKRVTFLPYYAGTRIAEAADMRKKHDGRDRLRFVGKGNIERIVPIHPLLREELEEIFSVSPARSTAGQTFQRLRDRVGALDIMGRPATPHSARRTCGQTMYDAGAAWEVADSVLGHALPGAGSRYIDIAWDLQVAAVNLIDYFAGQPTQLALW